MFLFLCMWGFFVLFCFCFLRKGLTVAQAGPDLTMQTGLAPNSQRSSYLCLLSTGIKAGKPLSLFFFFFDLFTLVFGVSLRMTVSHVDAVTTEAARGYQTSGAGHTGA